MTCPVVDSNEEVPGKALAHATPSVSVPIIILTTLVKAACDLCHIST